MRRLAAGLTALTVLLAGTAIAAAAAQHKAARQRNEALSLRASDAARDLIASRPRDAAALALAAYRLAPTAEARDTLVLAHAATGATTLGRGFVNPPGRFAATYDTRTLGEQLWRPDGTTWRPASILPTANSYPHLTSIDERRAIYYTEDNQSLLWDLADLDRPRRITVPADLGLMDSMDRTGTVLSAIGADKTAKVWRVGERSVRRLPAGEVVGTAMLADGTGVILSRREGDQDAIEHWTLDGRRVATLLRVPHPALLRAGPGGLIVIASYPGDNTMTIMDASDPHAPRIVARAGGLDAAANATFDTTGRTVAVVDSAGARIWRRQSGRCPCALLQLRQRLQHQAATGTVQRSNKGFQVS